MKARIESIKVKFLEIYGEKPGCELRVFASPGRVNLIGEHIDYCGGLVFPAALTLDNIIVARKTSGHTMKLAATDLPDRAEVDYDNIEAAKSLNWGNYQAGVASELMKDGYKLTGCEMLFDGTVPFGSGLSSSASIEVVTAYALTVMSAEEYPDNPAADNVKLALIGQRAENRYIGVNCGIMDQFASAMGKKDCAMLLNCATLEYKYVPFKLEGYSVVLGNTNKKRALGESKYNERRAETDEALAILQKVMPDKKNLCEITPEEFEIHGHTISDCVIYKRAQHVVYENRRVLDSVNALENGDLALFGKILKEANDSIRELYEVTGFELDTMVDEALKVKGTIGARMTGAGFGGCTVNIVADEAVPEFIAKVGMEYEAKTGLKPEFYVCAIGDGARELK